MFIVLPSLSSAMVISIQVQDVLNGRSSYLQFNKTDFVELGLDWENIGSLDCNARLETEITDPDGKAHRIWSRNVALAPGDSTFLQAYYMPEKSGKYSANVLLHYCERIIPLKSFGFEYTAANLPRMNLSVSAESTESMIDFSFMLQENLSYLKIIPFDTPKTWIFEPIAAENLSAGDKARFTMKYEPVVWMPRNTTFAIVSDKGIQEVSVELKRADTFDWLMAAIISIALISVALNVVFYSRLRNRKSSGSEAEKSFEEIDEMAAEENKELEEIKAQKPENIRKKAAKQRVSAEQKIKKKRRMPKGR